MYVAGASVHDDFDSIVQPPVLNICCSCCLQGRIPAVAPRTQSRGKAQALPNVVALTAKSVLGHTDGGFTNFWPSSGAAAFSHRPMLTA